MTIGAHLAGGDEAIEAAAGTEIDDPRAWLQSAHREGVAHAGKRLDCRVRQNGDDSGVIA